MRDMVVGFVGSTVGLRLGAAKPGNCATRHGRARFVTKAVATVPTSTPSPPRIAPPPELYKIASETGAKNGSKPAWKIFLSSILGGAYIGFGSLLALTVGGNCPGLFATNPGLQAMVLGAFGLPAGLLLVLVTGAELFTGNTMTLTAALHEKKVTFEDLMKSWSFSFLGNLLGSLALAWLAVNSGVITVAAGPIAIAQTKSSLSFAAAFIRGILCNWLVTAAVYMASGATDMGGKVLSIWFPISAFVAMKFEHSVANMFMIPFGILLGAGVSWKTFFLANLLPVTLGNIVGGALIMASMNAIVFGSLFKKALVR
eukprot:Plantae.Rhodophyta-Purpureofilum_apyrenoidigerum.ctg9062.p1 GENE.Plantae.Rhodophyta-Purpureofilum_apyrenoidigerum.ctg9062~~Plantae.Rhodophyta-Purpureofilum_apyrenoidigerum.ctg9062.p1  ORF type:complete len:314 (+),score=37.15 Plantae.Rhodophyta-Purpureofilum_apyrenoidigerum.ctg9062:37-978(+)